jgi:hypothetical protein
MVQPPATGATHGPIAGTFVIEYVYRNNLAFFAGGTERRVISESQILAEPNN